MLAGTKLDDRLVRAMREGAKVLPEDLSLLRAYLRMIDALLEEKAAEVEPNWSLACAAAAEIETLQTLETAVIERAIGVRAGDLEAVRTKLSIWRAVAGQNRDGETNPSLDRLVLSIDTDLARLQRTLQ